MQHNLEVHQQSVSSDVVLQVEDGEEIGKALDTGDQVEFSVLLNHKLGTSVAEGVKLLCKAEDKRELGQASGTSSSCVLILCYHIGTCNMNCASGSIVVVGAPRLSSTQFSDSKSPLDAHSVVLWAWQRVRMVVTPGEAGPWEGRRVLGLHQALRALPGPVLPQLPAAGHCALRAEAG